MSFRAYRYPLLLFVTIILSASGFFWGFSSPEDGGPAYNKQIEQWHQQRIQSLTQNDSWLSLAGLYRLPDGIHSFGADSNHNIVFPPEAAPADLGTLTVQNQENVQFTADAKTTVYVDSSQTSSATIFDAQQDRSSVLSHQSLRWFVIERGGELYIRLKNLEHSRMQAFDGIERFPTDRRWRVKATFRPFEQPDTLSVPNILGQISREPLYGTLQFSIGGQSYSVAPLGDPANEEFFIIFGDQTNGNETYGGGRFVYASTPDENGITYIDFNKAYNPPCVFSPYATCPLPPARNRMSLAIPAGEKVYGDHH